MNQGNLCLFDSHAHLTVEEVYKDISELLKRAMDAGVNKITNICIDQPSLQKGLELSQQFPWVYQAGATTPHDVEELGERDFPHFAKAAKEKKLIAVGETGLDYYYTHSAREIQKKFLIQYLHLALSSSLPVIFHCRDAFSDLFSITKEEYASPRAILHCFTGTEKEAEKGLERGWFISFSGIVTFKKSEALRAVVSMVPLNQLLIETDTPYLAPLSKRGKLNEPSYIVETAKMIAEIKQISIEDLARVTSRNACDIFQI